MSPEPFGPGPAGTVIRSPTAWTDLVLARWRGQVVDHGDVLEVRTPDNPTYQYGNCLFLPGPLTAADSERWVARHRALHGKPFVCLTWDRGLPDEHDVEALLGAGFTPDGGVDLVLSEPITGQRRLRAGWRRWMQEGRARWYGAFDGGELVGQCGFAPLGRVGRFQSVETHPEARRRGVCSSLLRAVAGRHLGDHRDGLVLSADPEGPARGLYVELGFREVARRMAFMLLAGS